MAEVRRRSSLRKSMHPRDDDNTVIPCVKRRISFSGKHFVREFRREEEPKTWENSYEIFDHLNKIDNKNKAKESAAHQPQIHSLSHYRVLKYEANVSKSAHNGREFKRSSEDFAKLSYQTGTLCIDNSVDITLFENEKNYCTKNKYQKVLFEDITNINSFSLNESELVALPDLRSKILSERTADFMEDLKQEDNKACNHGCKNVKLTSATIHKDIDGTEYMVDCRKLSCLDGKGAVTICMNESLLTSEVELPDAIENSLKNSFEVDFSTGQENDFPYISSEKQVTVNNSYSMDIEKSLVQVTTTPNMNVKSEELKAKLDGQLFLQNCDDNFHIEKEQVQKDNPKSNIKAMRRPTIYFNQLIECSSRKPKLSNTEKTSKLYGYMKESSLNAEYTKTNVHFISERKKGQPPKLVVRKFGAPLANNSINALKVQEKKSYSDAEIVLKSNIDPFIENSLNFSSLSSESPSSPLIPLEYKAYNFKELNDEIDRGKIQLFSKTATVNRKSNLYSDFTSNVPELQLKQQKTIFFEDSITISQHSSSKDDRPMLSNDYFDFNIKKMPVSVKISQDCHVGLENYGDLDGNSSSAEKKCEYQNEKIDETIEEIIPHLSKYNRNNDTESLIETQNDTKLCFEIEDIKIQSDEKSQGCLKHIQNNVKSCVSLLENKDMDLDGSIHISNQRECESVTVNSEGNFNILNNPVRKTLFLNDEMDLCKSIQKVNDENCGICNGCTTHESINYSHSTLKLDPTMETVKYSVCLEHDLGTTKIESRCTSETQHMLSDIDVESVHIPMYKDNITYDTKISQIENKTDYCIPDNKQQCIENDTCTNKYSQTMLKKKKLITRSLEYEYDQNALSTKQSIAIGEKIDTPGPNAIISNSAEMSVSYRTHTNALSSHYNNFISKKNCLITPAKDPVKRKNLFEFTPRLSLTEFLAYEKKIKGLYPKVVENKVDKEIPMKRLSINLTPTLSVPKKRHPLLSLNSEMSELTSIYQFGERIFEDNVLKKTPPNQRKSRIPVNLNNTEEMNTSSQDLTINNNKEIYEQSRFQIIFENDENVTQSIQELRGPSRLSNTKPQKLKTASEIQQTGQPLIFEDSPITISDVSVYFHAQRKCSSDNIYEQLNGKSFQKRYMNLTCDSTLENIDHTHLSLVRTLSNENIDDFEKEEELDILASEPSPARQIGNLIVCANTDDNKCSINKLRIVSTMCHKCKSCLETFFNETVSSKNDSFVLPVVPPMPNLDLKLLRRLRSYPNMLDINILWRAVNLDSTIVNLNNVTHADGLSFPGIKDCADGDFSIVTKSIQKYVNTIRRYSMYETEYHHNNSPSIIPSFILHPNDIYRLNLPNWIVDYQMRYKGVMIFTHRIILSFSVILTYKENFAYGKEIQLKTVYLESHATKRNWKPIDYILDFQLKLNLPFDIMSLCKSDNERGVFKMMQQIDQVCIETYQMGIQLYRIVIANKSSIIRDERRSFVRKIVRRVVSDSGKKKRIEKCEIRIELLNVKNLCFKDITVPSLYNFREDIHLLPVGLTFLKEFLHKPLSYLKDF